MSLRVRGWCFTVNNYTDADIARLKAIPHRYLILGYEVGEQGTPHIQGYIEYKNPRRFNTVRLQIGGHIAARRGTPEQASIYCKKGGDFYEDGDLPDQGKRQDL